MAKKVRKETAQRPVQTAQRTVQGSHRETEMKGMIKVVSSPFWVLLIGGFAVLLAAAIWIYSGYITTTVPLTGLYHPVTEEYGEVICFPTLAVGKSVSEGMEFTASLPNYDASRYGSMHGTVTYTSPYVTTAEEMLALLGDRSLTEAFFRNAPVVTVICRLDRDPESLNGYAWSNPKGESLALYDGTLLGLTVTLTKERVISEGIAGIFGNG